MEKPDRRLCRNLRDEAQGGGRFTETSPLVNGYVPYLNVLELSENATWTEVKKAYRSQTVEYHPDKMMSMPPKIRAFAQEEQRRLNEAYEILRKHMGEK